MQNEAQKRYYEKNKKKLIAQSVQYNREHKEKHREYVLKGKKANREKYNEYMREYMRKYLKRKKEEQQCAKTS